MLRVYLIGALERCQLEAGGILSMTGRLSRLPLPPQSREGLAKLAASLREFTQEYALAIHGWAEHAATGYQEAVSTVSEIATKEATHYRDVFEKHRKMVTAAADEVKRHQRALGLA